MNQLPPRHSDLLLCFDHLLAVLELVHRLQVVPAYSVVVPVTQDVEDPLAPMVSVMITVATQNVSEVRECPPAL